MKCFKVILLICAALGFVSCCNVQEDCGTISDAICDKGECVCNKGFVLSSDGSQCLPYVTMYNGDCSEDAQCEWVGSNSHCDYVCRCKDGYRWYLGECKKYVGLGEKCLEDLDCYDGYNLESLTCKADTCSCSEGYYARGDTDCRKIASTLDSICALDIDCQVPNTDTICKIGICKNSSDEALSDLFEEEIEEIDKHLTYLAPAATSCTEDKDCGILNSYCYDKTGTCVCKRGYFFNSDGTTCVPELGVNADCKSDSDCTLKPGKCVDGVCFCRDYYFIADGNQKCVKTMSEQNWNCLSREWCYALGSYSYCKSSGTCSCSKIAEEYDEENKVCHKTDDLDPDMCTNDYECKYIHNGFCVDEKCGCQEGHNLQDNKCVPDIGAQCNNETICEIVNSDCIDGTCRCVNGYLPFENKCYLEKDKLGDDCEVDIQCYNAVIYSKCLDMICSCDEDHLPYNNTCYQKKEFGSYCNNLRECSLSLSDTMEDSIVCRNRMCQCPTGYSREDNQCSSGSLITGNFLIIATVVLLKGVFLIS